jgi:hypothetical protein
MLRTVSGIGTVRAKSVFAKEKKSSTRQAEQAVTGANRSAYLIPKAGFEPLPSIRTLTRQVFLKNRVWQRRLVVPVGSYTRKTLAIGR